MRGPGNMRRADEFDALLSAGDERRADEASAARYAELLEVVGALREVPRVEARPAFVADLRTQLIAAAQRQEVRVVDDATALRLTPQQRRGTGERRLAAALGGFAVVAASGSMAMASQGALPGDVLYPVKRAIENAQTNLESDDVSRATALIEHAEARLSEVEALAARGDAGDDAQISATLADFQEQSNQAAAIALDAYGADGDTDGVTDLRSFSDRSMDRLTSLSETLPTESRPALVAAAQNLTQIDEAAFQQCPECGVGSLAELPEFAVQSLAAVLDTSTGVETLPDMPEITEKDLAEGEKAARSQDKDAQGGPSAEPTSDTDSTQTGRGGDDPTVVPTDPKILDDDGGLVTNTIRKLTQSLGLGKDKTASDEESGGLIGTLTDLLGLTD